MERLYKQFWYGGTIHFLKSRSRLSYFFFPFGNLSIVVVVTLATASIALLCVLTSAEKKSISQLNMLELTFNSTVLKKIKHGQKQSTACVS